MNKYNFYKNEIDKLKSDQKFREIKDIELKSGKDIFIKGKKYLNLSSNDYLGIAANEKLIKEFVLSISDLKELQMGSASSRLLTGSSPAYKNLETQIAKLYKREQSLLFNSGYHANLGVVSALAQKGDVIFSDKLNHASIIDGMKLSGADFYRYKHLDYNHLEDLLKKHRTKYKNAIVITESVFSMDGDIADIQKLIELKNNYNTILIVDEAHAFGIFGHNGCGVSEPFANDIDLIVGTFGKAIGSVGAYIVGNDILIEYLINKSRSFIFSTALPQTNILWSSWIIQNKLPLMRENVKKMLETAQKLRNKLVEYNIQTLGESQIVPAIIGNNDLTLKIADKLQESSYFALPIRPPTVPVNTSRLRFSLTTDIEWEDIKSIPGIIAGELK